MLQHPPLKTCILGSRLTHLNFNFLDSSRSWKTIVFNTFYYVMSGWEIMLKVNKKAINTSPLLHHHIQLTLNRLALQ